MVPNDVTTPNFKTNPFHEKLAGTSPGYGQDAPTRQPGFHGTHPNPDGPGGWETSQRPTALRIQRVASAGNCVQAMMRVGWRRNHPLPTAVSPSALGRHSYFAPH